MPKPDILTKFDTHDRILFYFWKSLHDQVLDERTRYEDQFIGKEKEDRYLSVSEHYREKQKEFDFWMEYNLKVLLGDPEQFLQATSFTNT